MGARAHHRFWLKKVEFWAPIFERVKGPDSLTERMRGAPFGERWHEDERR
jgi:hypothetical protein